MLLVHCRFGAALPGIYYIVKLGICPHLNVTFLVVEHKDCPAARRLKMEPGDAGFDAVNLEGLFVPFLTVTTTYDGVEFDRYNGMREK